MSAAFGSQSVSSFPNGNLSVQRGQATLPVQFKIVSGQSVAREIVLTKEYSELDLTSQTSRQWMNIYPDPGAKLIVIGDEQGNYPSHDKVHEGLENLLRSEAHQLGEPNLSNHVAGFRDGNKYIVRIDGIREELLTDSSSTNGESADNAVAELSAELRRYEAAIQIAEEFAVKLNGEVILQADS